MDRRTRYDAVVIGGGPAGCVAAHRLAARGVRTLLIDYAAGIERKGEILTGFVRPVLRSLGVAGSPFPGLSPVISGSVVNWGATSREHSAIASPTGPCYLVDRPVFDEELRSAARSAGAELALVKRLPVVTQLRHGWEIRTATGRTDVSVTTPLLVDASGRRGSIVRRFGRRENADRLVCIYYLARGRNDGFDQDDRWLIAADRKGWWFSVRVGPAERVFCRFVAPPDDVNADWWSGMTDECPELSAVVRAGGYVPRHRRAFCARTSYSNFSAVGLAAAGDAAFALDPLSGQGLALALSQGVVVGSFAYEYLGGRRTALEECRAIQRREFHRMLAAKTAAYDSEPRWRDSPFWAQRNATPARRAGVGLPIPTSM